MIDLNAEVRRFNTEFARLQELFQQAVAGLKGESEFATAKQLTDSVTAKHAEWQQAMGPAIDWLEKEHKELERGLANTETRIAELEKQLNEALTEAEKTAPEPPPPPPVLVPGEGNPSYGLDLGAELLALIGLGPMAGAEKKRLVLGNAWELESVDWKVDQDAPEANQPPRPAAPRPAEPPRKPEDRSIGGSIDWNE